MLVATKLAVGETDSAAEVVAAINGAERAARESVPRLKLAIYLEPDVDTAPGSPSVDGPGVPAIPSDVDDSAVEDASRG